jgi:uncharacterized membrane protein YhaH (DUF805 family)
MTTFLAYYLRRSMNAPFTLSGRRNRTDYIVYQILLIALVGAVWLIGYLFESFGAPWIIQWLFLFPTIVIYLGAAISVFIAGAQRCRDIGWPGWVVFMTLIPFAGNFVWLLMIVFPGTKGENKYGRPPGLESAHQLSA